MDQGAELVKLGGTRTFLCGSIADKLCASLSARISNRIVFPQCTRNMRANHASCRSGVPCKVSSDRNYSCFRECYEGPREEEEAQGGIGQQRSNCEINVLRAVYYNSDISRISVLTRFSRYKRRTEYIFGNIRWMERDIVLRMWNVPFPNSRKLVRGPGEF
ncbi:uncharacterized protein LOC114945338 [Nylanderia fulva]|uniref:uncharacterized protein LOC114945338 n=1 Tax=Nylanderia fulva TaxID=613905 RepID=UPI0010FB01B5|nr:uncharacterized protein LOC114945338 [Nylanderia fulva]